MQAQNWKDPLADPGANFYDIQANFYAEWGAREQQNYQARQDQTLLSDKWTANNPANPVPAPYMKGGYKQFKRWEFFMEPRCYPSGDITLPSSNYEHFVDYLHTNAVAMTQYQQVYGNPVGSNQQMSIGGPQVQNPMSSTWTFAGPTGAPTGSGAGRINCVRFAPSTPTTVYVGAPAGGLWRSTNSGVTWNIIGSTDALASIGVTDIAIDPTNANTLYLATGDGDAGDTYSIGVLKSTDGGVTWNTTGLNWTVNQGRQISKLLIHPTNNQIVLAFTSNGIYRTTNGGTSWTQVQNTNAFKDAEFKPGDPNTIYAGGTRFWKSTDNGVTWTNITAGLPANTAINRMAIAVTLDATGTGYVYVLTGSAANSGFYGLYRSTDSGTTFTQRSSTPNTLGWSSTGNDTGGQSWYDLAIAASNTSRDVIIIGGVNIWRSTNGGTSWTINGHWTGTGAPYVHADVHDLIFYPGSGTRYFAGCDGGVFETTNSGGAWTDRSGALCIAQPYRIGLSASSQNLWLTGHQDNGTNLRNGAAYVGVMGGDGMDCFIDRTNNNVMYAEYYNGAFQRSTNGGGNWTGITTGLSGNAAWVTPWCQDPATANTLWCGYSNVFRSTNQGTSWTQMGTLGGSGTIVDIKVSQSTPSTIYVCRSNAVYKSTNTGGTWTNITGTLPVGSAAISRLLIDPADANNVWVTFSGYSAANKCFVTTNGGTSWTNISSGLPNLPANCMVYTPGSSTDAVYIGMDVGIYYRDASSGGWLPYFTGLPNVPIFDLEIYSTTGQIRAATYGRGVWEVDIYNPGTLAPIANFTANQTLICPGSAVNFTDMSSFTPTSWSWTFQGGTPATSTAQNPTGIVWNTPGTYSVTLVATNTNGNDTETKTAYITVLNNATAPPLAEGFESTTFVPAGWTAVNINNDGIYFDRFAAGVAPTPGNSARFDNYNNDAAGARDEMWCPRQTFASMTACQLSFDVAYARYDATYTDTLQVMVSTNCGATWTSVWMEGGTQLATVPDQTSQFAPTAAQWRNEVVSLAAYNGQANVLIKFVNRGHYGNCLYVDNVNITGTASALPSATFTASATTVCTGVPVNFTSTSTGSPTSWSWTFPSGTPASATTQNVTGVVWNTPGTYTVTHTATNGNGPGTTTQVITVNASPTVTVTSPTVTICNGSSVALTGNGASTYAWMPGSLTGSPVTVSPTGNTTYTVTGTAANGCTSTATRTISVIATPTVTATSNTTTICNGSSVTLTGNGASTYNWMPGSLSGSPVTVSPTANTTYTVTGTAANGCTATATRSIVVNPAPAVTASSATTTICSGQTTTLTGGGAATYNWMPGNMNGSPVTVSPATTTTYTVTGTAANGCTSTATRTITVNPTPTVTTTSPTTTICRGSSVTITANGGTTYSWMPGNLTGTSVTVSPTVTVTYTVTGTSSGCSSTTTHLITVNPTPTVTTTSSTTTVCGGGPVTLTANGGTSYTWMPGNLSGSPVTVNPTVTTTYTVTGTGSNGCTATATRTITVNTAPTVTANATSTSICTGGTTTLTSSGASTYNWMPGNLNGASVSVSPSSTTTYTVTGTAANGCTNTNTVTVTVGSQPTVTVTANTAICNGSSITLSANGTSTYNWMPGNLSGASVTVSPGTTTTYTVTGTNSPGCSNTASVTVTVNAVPNVTATSSTMTVCVGSPVTLTGNGASTYTWMPGSLSGSPVTTNPTVNTTYTVTGTDVNGCTDAGTITITTSPLPIMTVTPTSASICPGGTVNINATPVGTATFSWSPTTGLSAPNSANTNASPLTTTTYVVTKTNSFGCSLTDSVTITVNTPPAVSASVSSPTICAGNTVTLNSAGASTYNWMPGNLSGSSVNVTPPATTTYTVTGTDANGCTNTETVTVTVGSQPTVSVNTPNIAICNGDNVTLTASGTTNYTWNPGNLSGATIVVNPGTTTTYTVIGDTGPGCADTATVAVTVNPLPVVSIALVTDTFCSIDGPTALSGGSPAGGTYSGPGVTANAFDPASLGVGTYNVTYTFTDVNGCADSASQQVVVDICSGTSTPVAAVTGLSAVPNPNNGDFVLSFGVTAKDDYVLEIYNTLGQTVYTESLNNFSGQYRKDISLSGFERGCYSIRLRSSTDESVIRVITF
jgi:PKD repeat protein